MERLKKVIQSLGTKGVIGLVLFGCFVVYAATVDRTVYVSERMLLLPGSATSAGFENPERSLIQDLGDYTLFQDFNANNSAALSEEIIFPPAPEPSNQNTDPGPTTGGTQGDGQGEPAGQTEEGGSVTPEVLPESDVEEQPEPQPDSEPTAESSPAPINETEVSEPVSSLFNNPIRNQVTGQFPYAQEATQEPVVEEPVSEAVEDLDETALGSERVETDTAVSEESVSEIDEEIVNPELESVTETPESISPSDILPEPEVTTAPDVVVSEELLEEALVESVSPQIECSSQVNCTTHSITYTDFNIPEFERGTVLNGVQLRLSLAAQTKSPEQDQIQRFVIEYSFDGEVTWSTASVIDIDEEISNSINGGFFLANLPNPPVANSLAGLAVRVSYQGDITELNEAFVEAVWLELNSGRFYEEGDPFFNTDTIDYERNLESPKFHSLHTEGLDMSLNELPSFTMDYDPQQNFLRRIFTGLFSDNTYEVGSIELVDSAGVRVEVPFEVVYHDDTTWTVEMMRQPQKMQPGKYELRLTINENDAEFVDVFEFYWGVLAVNTTKSMYAPNEAVALNLAALTDKGDTICDAELALKIIDPANEIYEVPVQQSGSCGPNNVTDISDYIADFRNTGEVGVYQILLEHKNQAGEVVHKIADSFEVRDYIPFDITRTAPTRIYPPAPYTVTLAIKANRAFTGDIVERVPRGFVFADTSGAEVTTLEEATLLTWKDVVLEEGDELTLSYVFDAPDISPYMYLLGPLDMDGFTELRQWQIASDAISAVAVLSATQTELGTNLNDATAGALIWSTSTLDAFYFSHSTGTTPERLFVEVDGDYLVSVALPLERTDTTDTRTRVGFEVRVNGAVIPQAISRSGYMKNQISNGNRQGESSSNGSFLLTGLSEGDYIEVYAQGLTTSFNNVIVSGQASLYVEHITPATGVFAATATSTTNSANLNQATAFPLRWTETRQDTGFVHSDTINPENIIISEPGTYLVYANVPLFSTVTQHRNVLGRVTLGGVQVPNGIFSQGYHNVSNSNDFNASIHFSGIVVATTTDQVLTITTEQESSAGTTVIPTGFEGSIYIQKLPTDDVIALRGQDPIGGTNWNVSPAQAIGWNTQDQYDSTTFTHSTGVNNDQIIINEAGDYVLVYNDALFTTTGNAANVITVTKNGVAVAGAQTKTHHISAGTGHNDSSGSLTFTLEGLVPTDVIRVTTIQEGANATINDRADASLLIWKKRELNFRPGEPTMFDTPFDNIRFASTTPYFDFAATDPDGTSNVVYEFTISTTSDFSTSVTRISDTDAGFVNTASSTDASPFTEGERIRFQLQPGDALQNNTTYYWRVRAKDVTGSAEFGDWSTTQSLTVDVTVEVPNWHQTTDAQLLSNQLTGVASAEGDGAVVDIVENTEAILVYGEKTDTLLKYRFWDGLAWTAETNGPDLGGQIFWAETSAGNIRDEYVGIFLTADGDTNALVYSASSSTWGSQTEFETAVNTPARRGIAVAHESVSGRAIAVSCSTGTNPNYTIWDGSSWSTPASISVGTASNCNWLKLVADPESDEMILVVKGAANNYEAVVWDGTAWGNNKTLGRAVGTNLNTDGMSAVYEASGDQALVVSSDASDAEFVYSAWNGVEWLINVNVPVTGDFENGRLVRDVGTDRIGLCMVDDQSDINAFIWDGTAWGTETQLEPLTESVQSRPFDCLFETVPGRDGNFIVAYSDSATDEYQFFDTTWSGPLDMSNMEEFWYLETVRTGDGTLLAVGMENVGIDPLRASEFNGTSWSPSTLIEADPAETNADPRSESFSLSAKRFSFAQGELLTQPIDFSFVPGQPSWGDMFFNTTEPIGTSVSVRVKYSNVGVCDAYIPNGTLPGNDVGFTVEDGPIDLSGLSTTTYNQICLEATINRSGDVSAVLNDWTLTWVREPKLIQNQYRWYVNGSFLSPVDPWPFGVNDLAENTPLGAAEAINIEQSIRLRMSLQGLNIDLPAATETFKLQYAEGLTCSPTLNWQDVGGIGSTTAVWRGFENSVVGSDWYNAAWARRVEITIPDAQVSEDLTDFPVYVDMADLPVGFFIAAKSDGSDIRITEADGITELPYDLVSYNSGTQTGELHFKADLASTTDNEFYIYYGNSGASAYAPSATYGSQNVWNNNFNLRYAMDDSPVSASPQFKDSTANGNDAITRAGSGMTSGDVVAGKIGQAINHDGNDGAFFENVLTYTGTYTISMWWRTQNIADGNGFAVASADGGANEKIGPWNTPSNGRSFIRVLPGGASDTTINHPADGTWTHVVITRDASNKVDIHFNGTANRLYGDVAQSGNSNWHNFGGDPTQGFEGDIDELRFSPVRRTNGWIATEYANQLSPIGFYDVSAEELISDGRNLPSTLLSLSDYAETYEEQNPTRENQNLIVVGNDAEWDFVLQNNLGLPNTNYCFRMVYDDGALLSTYDRYPRLITNAPPLEPDLFAPFDNEQLASTSPWFEFAVADQLDDDVSYEIVVDNNPDFSSPEITRESTADFSQFENLSAPAERGIYTPGQIIRFIPSVALANNTTYYWRVRARDDNGSGAYGPWSDGDSFTVNTATIITTWFQTTQAQFDTNDLQNTVATVSDDVRIAPTLTSGTTTGTAIRFADVDTGNAWGELLFAQDEPSGDIKYSIEYLISGNEWALIPDTDLAGNSTGFDSSGVSLANLSPITYHTIRIRASFSGTDSQPRLQSWSITWGKRIETPTVQSPFDNAKVNTTVPRLLFSTTDPQADNLEYEVQVSQSSDFGVAVTYLSAVDSGFTNQVTPADLTPFTSGEQIEYEFQTSLTDGVTYWYRVRARDPLPGENAYSDWSNARSFTVDTTATVSTWHQTTGDQFATGQTENAEFLTTEVGVTSVIRGAMVAYGESTSLNPRYRLWDGEAWSDPQTAESIDALVEWAEVKAGVTRNEYALGTLGNDGDVNVQIFNVNSGTWGNQVELSTTIANTGYRSMDITYETISGELMAVSCEGDDAVYRLWDGSNWTASTTISLTKAAACEYIELSSDPTSNEIIAVFRHLNTGSPDYEVLVWNGSSWGNSITLGDYSEAENEGIAIEYEASGDQAVVVITNGNNPSFFYNTWNGSAWSGTLTQALQNDFESGVLKKNPLSDEMALCYIDDESDLGTVFWDGAAWDTFLEHEQTANSKDGGRPVSCEFETTPGREGYLMIPYSDTVATNYTVYATSSYSGELPIGTITDTWTTQTVRTADGLILGVFLQDEGLAPADRYEFAYWNGTDWLGQETLSTVPSVTGTPFHDSIGVAAQIFPSVTNASILSTAINFEDGGSPRFEDISFSDATPGASSIEYRVYYESTPGVFSLISDSALPGNSVGFSAGTVDISTLDTDIYSVLKLEATLLCDSGDCPTLEEWTIRWSEGVSVSGLAFAYDQTTPLTEGTVAIAVNGVLQVGKTAEISASTGVQEVAFTSAGSSTWAVPAGVTDLTVKAWGAGGGGGGGGIADSGAAGGGGGFVTGTVPVTPLENLTVFVGGGGQAGLSGSPAGAAGGGGFSGVFRTSTPLTVAGGGGGGGAGSGGISYAGVGTACTVSGASCTPTIPGGTAEHDVLVAVVHSRTDTAHTCTTNCAGWTEFSSQAGGNGRLSVWYLRRGAGAPANPTFAGPATESYTARIWSFRGVARSGNPFDVISANTTQAATNPFVGASLTSTLDNVMSVFVGGTLDDNTWGPAGGTCTVPTGVDANFYAANLNGSDNSIFLCYNNHPTNTAGPLGVPTMTQVANATDVGRWFTFALRPDYTAQQAAGLGGPGGGLIGITASSSGAAAGGSGGTQSGGGTGSGGASSGSSLVGGSGGSGTSGGVGGVGGINGGGAGGSGAGATAQAGGGGAGAGYFGGGGGASANSNAVSGAGGGGGSSYVVTGASATSTQSGNGVTPGGAADPRYLLGSAIGGAGGATSSDGVAGTNGRVVVSWIGSTTPGVWSIPNINVEAGDVITVFVTGADGAREAVAVTQYNGAGDVTGMQLSERTLTLGSADNPILSNPEIGLYEFDDNEDVFFGVNAGNELQLCEDTTCLDARLRILSGTTYEPQTNGRVVNFENTGTFSPGTTTLRVSGSWKQNGIFTTAASTVIFTATTSSYTLENATSSFSFFNVTFGETSSVATWNITKPLQALGTFAIDRGTLNRGTSTITVGNNLRVGNGGVVVGIGTTTFTGGGSYVWTDLNASSTNIGNVLIDGTAKTITLGSAVLAQSITIGADDTLNASGSNFPITVLGSWVNNNSFIPQGGTVIFAGTSTTAINRGTSAFNNLSFTGVGGSWSFTTPTLALNGTLTIATGTVTLPTGTTTIGRSFTNSGGTFLHNNGEVRMTSTVAGQTITQRADSFFNAFYDLTFSGSGAWAFSETAATTTRNMSIQSGTVTFPSGTLTVGEDFLTTGTGAFAHNNGEVIFLVQGPDTASVNNSSFNNVRVRNGVASATWYNDAWLYRVPVTINESQIDGDLTNFPVYVNLDDFGTHFFTNVKANGGDIRVTQGDGVTEVPRELVSINPGTGVGELHFRANSVSSSTNSTYYIYYGNAAANDYAVTDPFGARNVWSNGYALVTHLNDLTTSTILNSAGTINGTKTSANNPLFVTTSFIYGGQDFSADAIQFNGDIIASESQYSVSLWFNPDNLGGGNAEEQSFGESLYAVSVAAPYQWLTTGGTGFPGELRLCAFENTATDCTPTSGASLVSGNWYYASVNAIGGGNTTVRINGVERLSYTNQNKGVVSDNFTIGDLRAGRNINYDGRIDEVRVANVTRTNAWQDAEYRNHATTTNFYTAGAVQTSGARTFTTVNTNILGNLILEDGGDSVFPTGVLAVGGSFDNNASFDANGGTVRFNSTAGAETIAAGSSPFATLEFNNAAGTFTVTEHATATVAINLVNATSFTLQSGQSLTTLGTFTNAIVNANTTWTGATVVFGGNNDITTSAKTYTGDSYGTIRTLGTTTARFWNSTSTVYDTVASSSIYSQDHAGVDGDLFIFGDYRRSAGSEYWSHATDFDGANIGGTPRQVDVRFESGSTFVLTNASLFMQGATSASTTVAAQSGDYTITAANATINASLFEVAQTNSSGFSLTSSTTLAQFTNGYFNVTPGRSGITIDATTVNQNPGGQYFGINFATTTAGAATNVTLTGTPASFVWFRNGSGNLYGEAFDAGDGNPGSIRFDDSSFNITISGTIYSDDGVTPMGAAICDNVTPVVAVAVDGAVVQTGTCNSANGTYSIPNINYIGDADIAVYLDTNRPGTSTIALRSQTSGVGTTNGTTGQFSVNKPASVTNGDYLVVIIGKDDTPGITPPAGWTGYTQAGTTGNVRHTGIWYKRVTDATSEPASYTFTGDVNEVFSYYSAALIGVSPSNPEDVSFAGRWQQVQNSVAPSAPSLTTQTTNSYVFSAWYVDNDNAVTMPGAPWTTRTANIVSGENNNLSISSQVVAAPGATGGVAITGVGGTAETNMAQFAFRRDVATTSSVRAVTVTKTPSANITNFDLYQSRVIVRHEDVSPMTIADMTKYQFSNDSDVQFVASSSQLTVLPNNELFVWNNKTFAPGGDVTLTGNGNSNGFEGTLQIGSGAAFVAAGSQTHTLAGRFVMRNTGSFTAASSTVIFNASTTGKSITASTTVAFNELQFNGTGGGWNITAPLTVAQNINLAAGTVTGTSNITIQNGSFFGNGVLSLGTGTTTINQTNTLGGTTPWTFANLVLGNGSSIGTTTPASTATTTILGRLTISPAHFLNAQNSSFDLAGTGVVLQESGTLLEGTGTIRYSGNGATVANTTYYNLLLEAGAGTPTYVAAGPGILVLNNLTVGGVANSTFNLSTNNASLDVNGNVTIASNGTLIASASAPLTAGGSWQNNGTFTASNGTVTFDTATSATVNPGNSSFANLNLAALGAIAITNNATATANITIASTTSFTQNSGTTLAIGNRLINQTDGSNTTWTGSTLSLYGGGQYEVNTKTGVDNYDGTLVVSGTAQPRFWNSNFGTVQNSGGGSIYSMNHAGNSGELYIYGNYNNTTYADHWSYATDFDGTVLGSPRPASVFVAGGSSVTYSSSSISVQGTSTATTTIQNQGSGTYELSLEGNTTATLRYVAPRNLAASGIEFSGTPTIVDIANADFFIQTNSASALTVAGSVINANPAKNLNINRFEAAGGVTGAINVTVTGSSVSSWRFTNEYGNRAGELYDADAGDPGEIVWTDSAALITISGSVFSDEGSSVSSVCDGSTPNIRIVVAGVTSASTTCNGSGNYSFTSVGFNANDSIIVYINGEAEKAATVTYEPISNITNMDLYENRVIVRHEGATPIAIEELAVYDSSDDGDIPFTADTVGSPDTLVLPANRKLLVWNNKQFTPNGNVTITGGGGSADYDGTLEARAGGQFIAQNSETHTIGGSLIFGSGAVFTGAQSSVVMTTDDASRVIDVNGGSFHNLSVTGPGSLAVTDTTLTVNNNFTQTNGSLSFPTGTTTIGSSFIASGGDFDINGSPLVFTSTVTGRTVTFGDSDVANVTFAGVGGAWNITDVNATATESVVINAGAVTLPSGTLTIGGDFNNASGTIAHNTSELVFTSPNPQILRARGSDLHSVRQAGVGALTMTDTNATLLGSLIISAGSVNLATGTLAVGGSLISVGGTFESATGTVLFNGVTSGLTINPGQSDFYNVQIGAPSGGYTLSSATTTNNFTLASVNNFTLSPTNVLRVEGVFTNTAVGANTTWTGSTLVLGSGTSYSVNTRISTGDFYENLILANNTDVRFWYSQATTTTVASSASLYSQDHANVNGALNVYGDFVISTTTEYWSYATDFDGTPLGGSPRKVTVRIAGNATTTMQSGGLQIVGGSGNTTDINNQGSGQYNFVVTGGTFNANQYSFANLSLQGLQFTGLPTITDLSNGYYEIAADTGSLITLSSTTLNANASKVFNNVGFNAVGPLTGFNVNLVGVTDNAWRFTNAYGNIGNEGFDVDGLDACGSIRFDDSACLLTEQTNYRWRNDDGGAGVPDSEWFNTDWDLRKRVRITNPVNQTYSSTSVKIAVAYESDMLSNFSDLRFTAGDGITPIPYWIERFTASTDATVWVKVPTLPANGQAVVHMYYGNAAATTTTSNGAAVFNAFEDFERTPLSGYTGDTGLFQTDTAPVFGGTYALEASNKNGKTTDGIFRFDRTVAQGEIIRYMQYVDIVAGSGDEACTLFGVQSPGTTNENYAVCLEQFGTDRIALSKDVENNDTSGTVLASKNVTYSTGWYEVEIDWLTNDTINVALYNPAGVLTATTSATDASYTSGGIGFAFWFNYGAWDSYTSRVRTGLPPEVFIGAPQGRGGATWRSALNTPAGGVPGETLRLRMAIENSGLEVTQSYQLEYAPKGAAPSCEAVLPSAYEPVPNQASCGSSPVCMQSSTQFASGDATTDLLLGTNGDFVSGELIESPNSITSALVVDQFFFTELEYAVTPTINAADAYCFRATNNGTPLDFYSRIPELGLQFDPFVNPVDFNNGMDINNLTPGTTTRIYASSTVTDFNGFTDLVSATATVFRTGVGAICTPDNNNCYVETTDTSCSFTQCSDNSCELVCAIDIFFHADPTDTGTYLGEEWFAFLEVRDAAGTLGFNDSQNGLQLLSVRAIDVVGSIDYGALAVNEDTGAFNPSTSIINLGNVPVNIDVQGTDLTDGASSFIPAEQQKFATSTFNYSLCGSSCGVVSADTPVPIDVDLIKPTAVTPPISDEVYWGIAIPVGTNSVAHQGINVFTPISP